MTPIESAPTSVHRFYSLEYFYILLKGVARYRDRERLFESFKELKHEHHLGESKFKRLTAEPQSLTPEQIKRYQYTFDQVIDETKQFQLIDETGGKFVLTEAGKALLDDFEENRLSFNQKLLTLMEQRSCAFRYLVERMYTCNPAKGGVLIFPMLSPWRLGAKFESREDIVAYAEKLAQRLETEIFKHLGQKRELRMQNQSLLLAIEKAGLLPTHDSPSLDQRRYNKIVHRFRKFWLNFFLQDIYECKLSLTAFDIWIYRAKQLGIIHATETFPNFTGRVVYPLSVVTNAIKEYKDFRTAYKYDDKCLLLLHAPQSDSSFDDFVDKLAASYFSLKRTYRTYFLNLMAVREIVCYQMKISEYTFECFLGRAYQTNLAGQLKIRISLEVDRLPVETRAVYQKHNPIVIDGRICNIIAIDVSHPGVVDYGS